jgi:hypothetical protein
VVNSRERVGVDDDFAMGSFNAVDGLDAMGSSMHYDGGVVSGQNVECGTGVTHSTSVLAMCVHSGISVLSVMSSSMGLPPAPIVRRTHAVTASKLTCVTLLEVRAREYVGCPADGATAVTDIIVSRVTLAKGIGPTGGSPGKADVAVASDTRATEKCTTRLCIVACLAAKQCCAVLYRAVPIAVVCVAVESLLVERVRGSICCKRALISR